MTQAVTKTYTLLSTLPHPVIEKCSEMLPNKMQCWKAADFDIAVTTPAPTKDDSQAVTVVTYQKCRAHAQAEKNADAAAEAVVIGLVAEAPTSAKLEAKAVASSK